MSSLLKDSGVAGSTASSHQASAQMPAQLAQGYPPMSAANLASMYAAYFPYYMNQFPGASPYGSTATPHPQSGYAPQYNSTANKYQSYPAPHGAASSNSQPKPANAAGSSNVYGGLSYQQPEVGAVPGNTDSKFQQMMGQPKAPMNSSVRFACIII
jgi:hypothetical protein